MSVPLIYQDNKYEKTDIYYPTSVKEIIKTEQIWINNEEYKNILSELCHISKNLWNEGDYIVRQLYTNNKCCLTQKDKDGNRTGQYIKYSDLDYLIKNKSENYYNIPPATSQQILKILDRSWKSFFIAIKDWKLNPLKYLGRPKLPGYLKKDGEFLLVFTSQQCKIKYNYLIFPKKIKDKNGNILKIKTRLDDETNLREVRIIPKGGKQYIIEIVYNQLEHQLDLNKDRIIGIDFGLRNIVTISNNIGQIPVCIKGCVLKSINQFYNKRRSEIQSIYNRQPIYCQIKDKSIVYRRTGPAIQTLTNNRNRKIKDAMHKYSREIIDYCINHNVGTIVIGHNPGQKQDINLGTKTNQNFVNIPEYLLRKMIKYKGEEIGIQTIDQEESHTSKCSFLDDEPVGHSGKYMGKRISRGLFRSSIGKLINADVQGGYNIIKKAFPKSFMNLKVIREDGIEGVGLHPIRINPLSANRNINIKKG